MLEGLIPRGLIKTHTVRTDNLVFRLHYQVSTLIFVGASAILVSNQLFGNPIDCFTHGNQNIEEHYKKSIDTLCWVTSTFTVKEDLCGKLGSEVPYPGVGILTPSKTPFDVHVTYRFLFFVFFLQGISFRIPHFIWKSRERNKMKMLSTGLHNPLIDDHTKSNIFHSLANYLLHGQINGSIKYSFHLHFCELMNLVIVGMNIWITDYLFRKEFIGYGLHALAEFFSGSFDNFEYCDDPIKFIFPQVAKCIQRQFGPSGNIKARDHLCVLPLNDFNIVFFKFLWVWFAILLTASVFWLQLRVVTFYSCKLRCLLLSRRAGSLPVSTSHMHDGGSCCRKICSKVSYADWVILMQLGTNMDALTYKHFLEFFCQQIRIRELKEAGKPAKIIDKIYYSPV